MGVIRSTFVINGDGVVTHALYNVRAKGHMAKVATCSASDEPQGTPLVGSRHTTALRAIPGAVDGERRLRGARLTGARLSVAGPTRHREPRRPRGVGSLHRLDRPGAHLPSQPDATAEPLVLWHAARGVRHPRLTPGEPRRRGRTAC